MSVPHVLEFHSSEGNRPTDGPERNKTMDNITPRAHDPYERRSGGYCGVTILKFTRRVFGILYGFDVIYDGATKAVTVFTYRGNGTYAEPSHIFRGRAESLTEVRRAIHRR